MSAHQAHLFAAELTAEELASLRADATAGTAHGIGGTERTYVEVATFAEIRASATVDWATLGMLAQALADRPQG